MRTWINALALGLYLFNASFAATTQSSHLVNFDSSGLAVHGYDIVSYFSNQVAAGDASHEVSYQGVRYQFSSDENLTKVRTNPEVYLPQYGGRCATAMSMKMKRDIDPSKYLVTDGKLFLFSNVNGADAREMWLKDPGNMQLKADQNWSILTQMNPVE